MWFNWQEYLENKKYQGKTKFLNLSIVRGKSKPICELQGIIHNSFLQSTNTVVLLTPTDFISKKFSALHTSFVEPKFYSQSYLPYMYDWIKLYFFSLFLSNQATCLLCFAAFLSQFSLLLSCIRVGFPTSKLSFLNSSNANAWTAWVFRVIDTPYSRLIAGGKNNINVVRCDA